MRASKIYDELHHVDLIAYFDSHSRSCEVITGAATLIHFGPLDEVFQSAARCLLPGGLFVLTLFPNDDDRDRVSVGTLNGLLQGACFRHGKEYLTSTAHRYGFRVDLLRRETHEYARSLQIAGLVVALRLNS